MLGLRKIFSTACTRIPRTAARCLSASSHKWLESVIFFGLPRLSPAMTSGRVRFVKAPGEAVECYDLLFEVDTTDLTETHNQVGHLQGSVTLQVESQESGYLAKVLVEEGQDVKVGTPIAILVEEEDDLAKVTSELQEAPYHDLYSHEAQARLRVGTWQAYLKGKRDDSCNACG